MFSHLTQSMMGYSYVVLNTGLTLLHYRGSGGHGGAANALKLITLEKKTTTILCDSRYFIQVALPPFFFHLHYFKTHM